MESLYKMERERGISSSKALMRWIRNCIRDLLGQLGITYMIKRVPHGERVFNFDGIFTTHNHDFMRDISFQSSYRRALQARKDGLDLQNYWRAHIFIWAGITASKLPGDYVECGVNYGFHASCIMEYLDWDSLGKTFWLMDTFSGVDPALVSSGEKSRGRGVDQSGYVMDVETVMRNFSEWKNVEFVVGSIPDTLKEIHTSVAFLHLDMNNAKPEVAALEYFWDLIVPGGILLFDDYGFPGHHEQKIALDKAANSRGLLIASLPTGQGLLIKPPGPAIRTVA